MAEERKLENDSDAGTSQNPIPAFALPKKSPWINKYAFGCVILASITSILMRYDHGVISKAIVFMLEDFKLGDLKAWVLTLIMYVYPLLGSAAVGRTSDWIGRRYTILLAEVTFFVGSLMMSVAPNYPFSERYNQSMSACDLDPAVI